MTPKRDAGMSLIVKTVARWTVGLIFVYGLHIILHGHLSPGGGFAGGVIMALGFVLLLLAFGREWTLHRLPRASMEIAEGLGALMFLGIALLGFVGGVFFFNWFAKGEPFHLLSGGMIPLGNIAISLKVGAGLFAVVVALVLLHVEDE